MTALTWHKGPPPHVGFWFTCTTNGAYWRWWNMSWSIPISTLTKPEHVAFQASLEAYDASLPIEWCYYWPENARVARINPETGEVTGAGPMPCEVQV